MLAERGQLTGTGYGSGGVAAQRGSASPKTTQSPHWRSHTRSPSRWGVAPFRSAALFADVILPQSIDFASCRTNIFDFCKALIEGSWKTLIDNYDGPFRDVSLESLTSGQCAFFVMDTIRPDDIRAWPLLVESLGKLAAGEGIPARMRCLNCVLAMLVYLRPYAVSNFSKSGRRSGLADHDTHRNGEEDVGIDATGHGRITPGTMMVRNPRKSQVTPPAGHVAEIDHLDTVLRLYRPFTRTEIGRLAQDADRSHIQHRRGRERRSRAIRTGREHPNSKEDNTTLVSGMLQLRRR